jgi:hypothetical protein
MKFEINYVYYQYLIALKTIAIFKKKKKKKGENNIDHFELFTE